MNGEKKFESVGRELTERIIGAAIEVHRELGCGLKEEAYEAALCWELQQRGLKVERQVPCPVVYKGIVLSDTDEHPKRIDLLVEDRIVVELKAVLRTDSIFFSQCLTYLKMLNLEVGLVLNFGYPTLKEGIRHVLNTPRHKAHPTHTPLTPLLRASPPPPPPCSAPQAPVPPASTRLFTASPVS